MADIEITVAQRGAKKTKQDLTDLNNSLQIYSRLQNNFANTTNRSNRSISRYQVLTQQAGYQVGDFLVQVQSGTNAMVAFGQQATQVAGTLTLLQGKWVLIGSALGIAIPLATALGAAFMRTRKETEKSEDAVEGFNKAVKATINSLQTSRTPLAELSEDYGRFADEVQRAAEVTSKAKLSLALSSFGAAANSIQEPLTDFQKAFKDFSRDVKNYSELSRVLGERTVSNASAFNDASRSVEESQQRMREAAGAMGLTSLQAKSLNDSLKQLAEAEGMESVANAASSALEQINKMFSTSENMPESVSKIAVELEKVLRAAAAGAVNLDNSAKSASKMAQEFQKALEVARDFVGLNIKGGVESAATSAAQLADQFGVAYRYAFAISTMNFNPGANLGFGVNGSTGNPFIDADNRGTLGKFGPDGSVIGRTGRGVLDLSGSGSSSGGSGGGGGGKSIADQTQEYIENLQKELDNKKKLVGVYGEERDIREQTTKLLEQVEEKGLNISEKQLERHVRQMNQLEERIKFEENLYDTLHGGIEDGLMALIDGTKSFGDVARNTMRQIILDVYKQAFVKPVASSIAGSIFGAIFDGGGYTGSGPRSGGVDGKGGFPAILHPNETVVDHTKGQSMGSINITQNFNFTANGDETIKRIISQEAPKIADYTKKSVLEARSRGGPWKQRFGG